MKIGRSTTTLYLLLWALLLAACQDKAEPVTGATFTPSPTVRPSETITAQAPTPAPQTTTAVPTLTPTPIPPTVRAEPVTAEPTFSNQLLTPLPTATPIPPTPFPNILLTPGTPSAAANYRLRSWTAEDADNLARLMEEYNERMAGYFSFTITQYIANSFAEYPTRAYQEAQLRFPDSPLLTRWQLGEAAHRAISNDPNSADLIRERLIQALNNGQTSPTESALTTWLDQSPMEFWFQLETLQPPPGYSGSYVIAVGISGYGIGGTTIWVLENETDFTGQTLHSNLGKVNEYYYGIETAALTKPDDRNVIITTSFFRTGAELTNHIVYNLNQPEPLRLEFGPHHPWLFNSPGDFTLEKDENGQDHIVVEARDIFFCDLSLTSPYEWNGRWFEQVEAEARIWPGQTAEECLYFWLSTSSYLTLSNLDRAVILADFEDEFGDFQPSEEDWIGLDFGLDSQDQVRFTLAFNHAVLGNITQAQDYLRLIVETPSIPDSRWIQPATSFLEQYDTAENLYPACLETATEICNMDAAFTTSISYLPPMDWSSLRSHIINWGTAVAATGSFDFDNDGTQEQWLALRHQPNAPLELWILSQTADGWQSVYVYDIESLPLIFQIESINLAELTRPIAIEHTIFSINNDNLFAFYRHPITQQPYTWRLFYKTVLPKSRTETIVQQLWDGISPEIVIDQLTALEADPTYNPSAKYYYYLGLAYELSGDETNAAAAYLKAWQDHCCEVWDDWNQISDNIPTTASPYAIMAQAKLIPQ